MGKEPPPIIDADFDVVHGPDVQWQPAPRLRLAWYAYTARAFCVAVVAFGIWDIWSDGVPTRAIHQFLFGS